MQQFKDMQSFGAGLLEQLGCRRVLKLAEIFPDLDEVQPEFQHQTIKVEGGSVTALRGLSVAPIDENLGVDGLTEYAMMQNTVKFKKLELSSVFFAPDADSIFMKISKKFAFELSSGCIMKVRKNRHVQPVSFIMTIGRALQVAQSDKDLGVDVHEPTLDEVQFAGTEGSATVADVKAIGEPMQFIEGQAAELPKASITINIDNSKDKKSKSKKSKGKKKGKSKRK